MPDWPKSNWPKSNWLANGGLRRMNPLASVELGGARPKSNWPESNWLANGGLRRMNPLASVELGGARHDGATRIRTHTASVVKTMLFVSSCIGYHCVCNQDDHEDTGQHA